MNNVLKIVCILLVMSTMSANAGNGDNYQLTISQMGCFVQKMNFDRVSGSGKADFKKGVFTKQDPNSNVYPKENSCTYALQDKYSYCVLSTVSHDGGERFSCGSFNRDTMKENISLYINAGVNDLAGCTFLCIQ